MSDAPISAAEPPWTPADADCEDLQLRAREAEDRALRRRWRLEALELSGGGGFGRHGDPRHATSLVNLALLSDERLAACLLEQALAAWDAAVAWVDGMTLPPRARSSLFHLRLEAKHRGAYAERERHRLKGRLDQARAWTAAVVGGRADPVRPAAIRLETLSRGDLRRL